LQVVVIGAGLAGCEAAWQAARRGLDVTLVDMKPAERSPAHRADWFAELVCSNSLRSNRTSSAVGLLKEEMRRLGSLVIAAADESAVPAGQARRVPPTVWKSTSDAVSPPLNVVGCVAPSSVSAASGAIARPASARAATNACSAEMPGDVEGAESEETGEPWTLIKRPSFATFAWRPLPNSGIPAALWTQLR